MDTCPVCQKKKFEMRNGEKYILRCDCEWQDSYLRRMAINVHSDYWLKWPTDWNPKIYDEKSSLSNFIKLQKAAAMIKLYQFAFKKVPLVTGETNHSIYNAIDGNRNLFIRGVAGSGRGLIAASIKKMAVGKEINITPSPSEFDIFKSECLEAVQFGKTAEDMRIKIESKYVDPEIMFLEEMKSEIQIKSDVNPNFTPLRRKFKAFSVIDSVITKRIMKNGCIVVTSGAFLGEIMDDYGERLVELLADEDKTSLILMFSIPEVEEIKNSIVDRLNVMHDYAEIFCTKKSSQTKAGRLELQSQKEQLALLEEGLYLYAGLKHTISIKLATEMIKRGIEDIFESPQDFDQSLSSMVVRVKDEKKNNTEGYKKSVLRAIYNSIRSRKTIGPRLSDVECMEASRILAKSDSDKDTKNIVDTAEKFKIEMSGGAK